VDKLFFAGIVDASMIVDYGCADGALLRAYHRMFPSATLIGYDQDPDMISYAQKDIKAEPSYPNLDLIRFTHDWEWVWGETHVWPGKRAVVLSSVLHEIYSYLMPEDIVAFGNSLWNGPFDYVVIRDMMVSETVDRPSNSEDVARVRQVLGQKMVSEWEALWGPITRNRSLLHLLLTYRYTDNWTREIQENYLPFNLEGFMSDIPKYYRPIYFEHYTLPFVRETVKSDLDITITDRTHVKIVFERRRV
jgi:hypothetical protein